MTRQPTREVAQNRPARRALEALALVMALLASACERLSASAAEPLHDGSTQPARIVCAGSAVTETVYALGRGGEIVAVDTSSLFPGDTGRLPKVGYQRSLSAEGILALRPSLLLAVGEAGPVDAFVQLRGAGLRVEVFPVDPTLEGVRDRIVRIARVLERDPAAALARLDGDLAKARALVGKTSTRPKVLALYARAAHSVHVFGKHTAAATMVELAGGTNAVTAFEGAKPLSPEAVIEAAPDVILIPARGLESAGGERAVLDLPGISATPAGRSSRLVALDDLLLLGLGPRTGEGVLELCRKLHPELMKEAP